MLPGRVTRRTTRWWEVSDKEMANAKAGTGPRNPMYGREVTILTPATTILDWLAEDLGGTWEFGDP